MYKVKVLPQNVEYDANENELLLNVISKTNMHFSAPCGGKGKCKKCSVLLLEGNVDGVKADEDGYILSCQAKVKSDLVIKMETLDGEGLSDFRFKQKEYEKDGLGIILDIGTTTLAACLVDLKTGDVLNKISDLNPQSLYGADVLSRIQASQEGKLLDLKTCILNKTQEMILRLSNGKKISELVVGANTTMLHLFLGINPKTIGIAPFVPVFTDTQVLEGSQLGLSVDNIRLLPSASAYVGGDITAGVLSCEMHKDNATKLFIDIGTNGEVVLYYGGKLYATSTAAGPALEGACIECGVGGISGAIDKVKLIDGNLHLHTIDNQLPIGICGSGLIDIISILLETHTIDENGTFDVEGSLLINHLEKDRFYLTKEIYISQKDIRQFQLAKSAICSGIKTLLFEHNVSLNQVEATFIAGGLGYYMNLANAIKTGLLPEGLSSNLKLVGNTCLSGAHLCLCSNQSQQEIEKIAKHIEIIDLSRSSIFQDEYIENIGFWEN